MSASASRGALRFDDAAWLLGVGEPPCAPTADRIEAALALATQCWQVLPLLLERFASWAGAAAVPERLRDRSVMVSELAQLQARLALRIARRFDEAAIPYAILKGTACALAIHESTAVRSGLDVDLAVPHQHLARAEAAVRELAFFPAQYLPNEKRFVTADPVLRALVEARHYELGCFVRRQIMSGLDPAREAAIRREAPEFGWFVHADELVCDVMIDIHHGLALDIPATDLVRSSVTIRCDDTTVRVPPLEWMLFHLVYKIYWEGVHQYGGTIYQYADLARVYARCGDAEEDGLFDLLRRYRLEPAGYYVLRRLPALGVMPRTGLAAFVERLSYADEGADAIAVNDLGDMWPKLWNRR